SRGRRAQLQRPEGNHQGDPSLPPAEHLSDALRRSTLRPGIFGWAQVHFSQDRDAQSDMRQQITHDLFYIVNWSLFLDAKIILISVFPKRAR
ncbi:MAG: sugar transferase, partial [Beijerinckiaceae bacterium]